MSIFEIGMAMCLNCLVLNIYYRTYKMPRLIRKILLGRLAEIIGVKVPHDRKYPYYSKQSARERYIQKSELTPLKELPISSIDGPVGTQQQDDESGIDMHAINSNDIPMASFSGKCNGNCRIESLENENSNDHHAMRKRLKREKSYDTGGAYGTSADERAQNSEDWKHAARVLDRILLGLAVCVGVISAMTIFLQAERFRQMFGF